jgi:hypothetical protein
MTLAFKPVEVLTSFTEVINAAVIDITSNRRSTPAANLVNITLIDSPACFPKPFARFCLYCNPDKRQSVSALKVAREDGDGHCAGDNGCN